eukprot:TRINITY_DN2729_c0_g1_i1.p2 TRINITY_DN2729_c0_g1~~TRINITY_DN2729_c0_g1_i1.p2  ORF type:complete len:174 (+),score=39.32 TRINITY_DN2729_c0_g1_i1:910-1431(+)
MVAAGLIPDTGNAPLSRILPPSEMPEGFFGIFKAIFGATSSVDACGGKTVSIESYRVAVCHDRQDKPFMGLYHVSALGQGEGSVRVMTISCRVLPPSQHLTPPPELQPGLLSSLKNTVSTMLWGEEAPASESAAAEDNFGNEELEFLNFLTSSTSQGILDPTGPAGGGLGPLG